MQNLSRHVSSIPWLEPPRPSTGVSTDARRLHATATGAWEPLLVGESGRQARDIIRQIALVAVAAILERADKQSMSSALGENARSSSLAEGAAGVALFLHYAVQAEIIDDIEADLIDCLDDCIGQALSCPADLSLFFGLPGLAWTLEHLRSTPSASIEDPFSELDQWLASVIRTAGSGLHLDLTGGICGIGMYALDRPLSAATEQILHSITDLLSQRAIVSRAGVHWPLTTIPHYSSRANARGMAHGTAGCAAVLARVCARYPERSAPRNLLIAASQWLVARRRASLRTGRHMTPTWCWGDPGLACGLLRAAEVIPSDGIRHFAHGLLREAATWARKEPAFTDVSLCHGAAGLGHILNRSAQLLGDDELREEARAWFERIIALHTPTGAEGGYLFAAGLVEGEYCFQSRLGLMRGLAGVGLALLAAIADRAPHWDRCLAISAA